MDDIELDSDIGIYSYDPNTQRIKIDITNSDMEFAPTLRTQFENKTGIMGVIYELLNYEKTKEIYISGPIMDFPGSFNVYEGDLLLIINMVIDVEAFEELKGEELKIRAVLENGNKTATIEEIFTIEFQ